MSKAREIPATRAMSGDMIPRRARGLKSSGMPAHCWALIGLTALLIASSAGLIVAIAFVHGGLSAALIAESTAVEHRPDVRLADEPAAATATTNEAIDPRRPPGAETNPLVRVGESGSLRRQVSAQGPRRTEPPASAVASDDRQRPTVVDDVALGASSSPGIGARMTRAVTAAMDWGPSTTRPRAWNAIA